MNLRKLFKTKREKSLLVAAISIIAFGLLTAYCGSNWEYFERSGSLLIVLSIASFSAHHIKNLELRYQKSQKEIDANRGLVKVEVTDYQDGAQEFIRGVMDDYISRLVFIEAIIAVMGTLIWGYAGLLA